MNQNFYDKIAKKFGGYGYSTGPRYIKTFTTGDPEKIFKKKLINLGSKEKVVLDIGCADGKFTLSMAPHFNKVYGIDNSKVNLDIAIRNLEDKNYSNIEYSLQDASRISFIDSFFDVAYCRRGPSYYNEYHRILKPKGHYIEVGIGEKDCQSLKEIFGRGQGYGKWNRSRSTLENNIIDLRKLGFQIVFAEDFNFIEYYASCQDIDLFLQGVPIFEDFDSEKDKLHLKKYVKENTTDKGILLNRHRIVILVSKV